MLKIYLDWNCITHSKDIYSYILNIAEECGNRFIFPFSNAHVRDLLKSHNEGNKYYDTDLEILGRICGNNHLLFEDGQMMPKDATPYDVIDVNGDTLEKIQKSEFITPDMYVSIKESLRKLLPFEKYKRIQGAAPKDVISIIDKYISEDLPNQDLESILSLSLSNTRQLIDAELKLKTVCMALDMFGFRSEEKDKGIMNIDADYSHIFYAGYCDILVSADSKLRGKAEAVYQKYNYQTKVLRPEEFESFIDDELQKEYSLKYISEVIDQYGTPRVENDGAHYKLLPNHIFGIFNVCHKIDKFWGYEGATKAAFFRYSFNNTPYLFNTELTRFCNFIDSLLPSSEKEVFRENYVKPLFSKNYQMTIKARYNMKWPDLDMEITLYTDNLSPVPTPMMSIIIGRNFEDSYRRLFEKQNLGNEGGSQIRETEGQSAE